MTFVGSWVHKKEDEIHFFNAVLKQYRDCHRTYAYEYAEADKDVLRKCATDLRQFTYSLPAAGATFWLSGKLFRAQRYMLPTRIALGFLRFLVSTEAFTIGHALGSFKQGSDCMKKLVALPTPLGGEICALIRVKQPDHWLLKYEQPPAELAEDGSRPRIADEANRLAKAKQLMNNTATTSTPGSPSVPTHTSHTSNEEYAKHTSSTSTISDSASLEDSGFESRSGSGSAASTGNVFDWLGAGTHEGWDSSTLGDTEQAQHNASTEAQARAESKRRRRKRYHSNHSVESGLR